MRTHLLSIVLANSISMHALADQSHLVNADFEQGYNEFTASNPQTAQLTLNQIEPISGLQSLQLSLTNWSSGSYSYFYPWGQAPTLLGMTLRAKVKLLNPVQGGTLQLRSLVKVNSGQHIQDSINLNPFTEQIQTICQPIILSEDEQVTGYSIALALQGGTAEVLLDDVTLTPDLPNEACASDIDDGIHNNPSLEPSYLLPADRIARLAQAAQKETPAWQTFQSKLAANLAKERIYNTWDYAGAYALSYRITGNKIHGTKAKQLFLERYVSEPIVGWQYYSNRNLFRSQARWSQYTYAWAKTMFSEQQQRDIEAIFALWGDYWLDYLGYSDDFSKMRWQDTDEVTSLAENLSLLGMTLQNAHDPQIREKSTQYLNAGDRLLKEYVVDKFMDDVMAGGVWAEGVDYSPGTMMHWMRLYMYNKELRNIDYPNDYAEQVVLAYLHQTLAGGTGMYFYGDQEHVDDYVPLSGDHRYAMMLHLIAMVENPERRIQAQAWLEQVIEKEGYPNGSMDTGLERVLFEPEEPISEAPQQPGTFFYAPGTGLVASRSDWSRSATNLYFLNSPAIVDHQHFDTLSFDIAHAGKWITKEMTGYGKFAINSTAHNTILIENATHDGSSNPAHRAAGRGQYVTLYDSPKMSFIAARAEQTYNMLGYWQASYAKKIARQLVFLKPNIVLVYDSIETEPSVIRDLMQYHQELGLQAGDKYVRSVKQNQRFLAQPIFDGDRVSSINDGKEFIYQPILPKDYTLSIVDETQYYQDVLTYQAPLNQRKWHTQLEANTPQVNNELLSVLSFADVGEVPEVNVQELDEVSPSHLGVYVQAAGRVDEIVLFSKELLSPYAQDIYFTQPVESGATVHINGLAAGQRYQLLHDGQQVQLRADEQGEMLVSEQGMLIFHL